MAKANAAARHRAFNRKPGPRGGNPWYAQSRAAQRIMRPNVRLFVRGRSVIGVI